MSTFALLKIEAINGIQVFNKLIVDGMSPLDEFEESLEEVANLRSLPRTKFRELKGVKGNIKEYEFKSKHLRVYAIKQPNCKLVVMCGYKNSQNEDINKFRALKKQYIISQKK